jgi:shikimate dehydrogenase
MTASRYAEVIGDPIGHSRSPAIHRFWLNSLDLDGDYHATRVMGECLAGYFGDRRREPAWRGCNITIPHKQAALALVDSVEDGGIGAINCVLPVDGRLVGRNTDAGGFDASLPPGLGAGDRVVLVGGGGAAAAALAALKARGVRCDIVVRKRAQGEALLGRFGASGDVVEFDTAAAAIAGSAGLVNASPLGMDGFAPMPREVIEAIGKIGSNGFVLDMVYAPLRTGLLVAAEEAGLTSVDGLAMLIGQAALAFSYFFQAEAPRGEDEKLRGLLLS